MAALARRWGIALWLALAALPGLVGAAEPTLSQETYRQLTEIRRLMDQGASAQAVPRLQRLAEAKRGSAYEQAVILQHLGYARLDLKRETAAIEALQAALALGALPAEATQELRYLLAQLLIQQARYGAGLALLETWLGASAEPPLDAYLLAAHAALQSGQKARGAEHLARAIARATAPEAGWYELLAATYQELGRAAQAVTTLRQGLARYPGEGRLWQRLAAGYQLQGDEHRALAVLVLAYRQEQLPEAERTRLVYLYAQLGAPERAARLLRSWRDNGRVAATYDHLKLEADLWLLARERAAASVVLDLASRQADNGRIELLRGQIAYDAEDWGGARQAFERALARGGLADPATAQLLLGIAAHRQGDDRRARKALEQARRDARLAPQADYWLARLAPRQPD